MTALDYAWACLLCEEAGAGQRSDLEARKHTEATGHATTTHTTCRHGDDPISSRGPAQSRLNPQAVAEGGLFGAPADAHPTAMTRGLAPLSQCIDEVRAQLEKKRNDDRRGR